MSSNNFINSDEYQFNSYKIPTDWFLNANDGRLVISDEYTKDFFILNLLEKNIKDGNTDSKYNRIIKNTKIMSIEDTLSLLQLSEKPLDKKNFVLNNRLNRMSLQNWIIIKSWNYSMDRINSNKKINKIYSTPLLSIYSVV
jgi:hypothetical protein